MRRKTPKWLETKEIRDILDAVTKTRDLAIILVGYLYGLRSGEIGLLRMSDISMTDKTIRITRLKGSDSGVFPLLPAAAKALRAYFRSRGKAPGPVFLSRLNLPISRYRVDELFKKYCALAGIGPDRAQFRSLKHSTGTHLVMRGESVLAVRSWLGHRDLKSTMVYVGMAGSDVKETGKRLENSNFGGRRG